MPWTTLIEAATLASHLDDPDLVVVDCRFSLADPEQGRRAYRAGHVPGAVYAHLDEDLSGTVVPGVTGRHPLPEPEALAERLGRWGMGKGVQVVAYDDAGGAIAARLWWLLGWLGHDAVAVLDGGWPRWTQEGFPVRGGEEHRTARPFEAAPRPERIASVTEVQAASGGDGTLLWDARAPARWSGAEEPIDPVAGHIPGARSVPFAENLAPDGRLRSPAELRRRFSPLLAGEDAGRVIAYCGSGVTATHDLLALAHAGLGAGRLYAGSWSHWITDPERPVETAG